MLVEFSSDNESLLSDIKIMSTFLAAHHFSKMVENLYWTNTGFVAALYIFLGQYLVFFLAPRHFGKMV